MKLVETHQNLENQVLVLTGQLRGVLSENARLKVMNQKLAEQCVKLRDLLALQAPEPQRDDKAVTDN